MLERVIVNGVVFYQSPLLRGLGAPHGFSTRIGGVSQGPFDSMNLGNPSDATVRDSLEHIEANLTRLTNAIGCSKRRLRAIRQVHGSAVVTACADEESAHCEGDALMTADARCAVCIRVADCVPILLAGDDGRLVAAVHAGWRGVVAGVVPAAVNRMAALSGRSTLVAAIGPCIGDRAFEVGPEVIAEFTRCFGTAAPVRKTSGKPTVDLRQAVRLQLMEAGIASDRIDTTDRCTFRDKYEFFSHRRDAGVTGRMAAIIGPSAE